MYITKDTKSEAEKEKMVKYYLPDALPLKNLDYGYLIRLVGDANAELARYDGLLQGIINPEVLLSPLTTREAVLSSKIEGTQATLDEVLKHEAGMLLTDEQKQKDVQEIVNYRKVLILAEKELKSDRSSCLRPLLRATTGIGLFCRNFRLKDPEYIVALQFPGYNIALCVWHRAWQKVLTFITLNLIARLCLAIHNLRNVNYLPSRLCLDTTACCRNRGERGRSLAF